MTVPIGTHSRILASLNSSSTILAAYANPFDYAEWSVWKRHLRPGDLFVDVGANVGVYSLLAADLGASIVAVEPDPDNVRNLNANFNRNGYDAEVWSLALTNRPGDVHFTEGKDSENHLSDEAGLSRTVRGERFDTLIDGRHVHGMKVDVEGAELSVLKGAANALSEGEIDLIQLEWNDRARINFGESRESARTLLWQYGYALYRPERNGRLMPCDGSEGSDLFAARPATAAGLL